MVQLENHFIFENFKSPELKQIYELEKCFSFFSQIPEKWNNGQMMISL
jgi:hypothetical protein